MTICPSCGEDPCGVYDRCTTSDNVDEVVRRAYFACVSCEQAPYPEERHVFRANELRSVEGEPWCATCFYDSGEFPDQRWEDFPPFNPIGDLLTTLSERVKELEGECKRKLELQLNAQAETDILRAAWGADSKRIAELKARAEAAEAEAQTLRAELDARLEQIGRAIINLPPGLRQEDWPASIKALRAELDEWKALAREAADGYGIRWAAKFDVMERRAEAAETSLAHARQSRIEAELDCAKLRTALMEMEGRVEEQGHKILDLGTETEILQAERDGAVEVVRPFAEIADEVVSVAEDNQLYSVPVGALRRARAFLAKLKGPSNE